MCRRQVESSATTDSSSQLLFGIFRPTETFFGFAVYFNRVNHRDAQRIVGGAKGQDKFLVRLEAFFFCQWDVEPAMTLQGERDIPTGIGNLDASGRSLNVLRSHKNADADDDAGCIRIGNVDRKARLFGAGNVEAAGIETVLQLDRVVNVEQIVATKLDVVHRRAVLEEISGESRSGGAGRSFSSVHTLLTTGFRLRRRKDGRLQCRCQPKVGHLWRSHKDPQ